MTKKYALYEASVQSPDVHCEWFERWFETIHGVTPIHLREDFCGTFQVCCEWVKRSDYHTAVGLDVDLVPLQYGEVNHMRKLTKSQKERIWIHQRDVLKKHLILRDLIVACNFSFCIFQERNTLLTYFKNTYASLHKVGSLILEVAGGPGMIAPMRERKTIPFRNKKIQYTWHQRSFDPITHRALYSIHFKLPDGCVLKNAFEYDWRMWTLPELKELLLEAQFDDVIVYWESTHKGEGTGEYLPMTTGDNAYAWVAYVIANKRT
jgi:hypothetical protein